MASSSLLVLAAAMSASPPAARADYSAAKAPPVAGQLDEMLSLYDAICLQRFPDDAAVAREVATRQATPLTPAETHIYLHDDPGFGWRLSGRIGSYVLTIEQPPFHACGIRTMTRAGFGDLTPYRTLVAGYEKAHGPFESIKGMDAVIGNVRTAGGGEAKRLADGGAEALLMFVGTPAGDAARAAGDTAVEVRMIHQFAAPPRPKPSE